jgi:hypothetical protein
VSRLAAPTILAMALLMLAPTTAGAADDEGYDLPKVELKRIPPRFSWEAGAQLGFGEIGYWRNDIGWWGALGFQGAWGRNFGLHRIGLGVAIVIEGPAPIYMSLGLLPTVRWDWIHNSGLYLGAGAGPTFYWHYSQADKEHALRMSPSASFRIGWSQGWTRVGKRLFLAVEPKISWIRGGISPMFSLVIGSGRGY